MRERCAMLALSSVLLCGCTDIECVTVGEKFDVTYSMEDEVPITQNVEVGENGSQRGQCGSGVTATGWTMDCLRHDACQHYAVANEGTDGIKKELPGGLGPNCLDEFNLAIDDYAGSAEKCGS